MMVVLIIVSCIMFVVGAIGLAAVVVGGWSDERPHHRPSPPERPSRTVRVIRGCRCASCEAAVHGHERRGHDDE